MSTLTSSPARSRAINSASAVSVCWTNRREIAERDIDFCTPLTCSPTHDVIWDRCAYHVV